MNHIKPSKLSYAKDWEKHPYKNIADLFFYSLSYNNTQLINKCLIDWKNAGRDINDLFYSIDNSIAFGGYSYGNMPQKVQLSLCVTDKVGLKINSVQWGKMSPSLFMQFQALGLELPTGIANEFFLHALGTKNTPLMTFLLPYISFDKQPAYDSKIEVDNGINHSFIDGSRLINSIGRNLVMHFDQAFANEVIGYFPLHKNDLYIRLCGWAGCLKSDEVLESFMKKHDFIELLSHTENFIKHNANHFLLKTKNGSFGDDDEILSYLNKVTMFLHLQNKIPHKNFEPSGNKLKI